MTFLEMVQEVLDRLNLTSEDARTRVGQRVNDRYRRVSSSIGMITSRRTVENFVIDPTDSDFDNLPEVVITTMEKVLRVDLIVTGQRPTRLEEVTYDDLVAETTRSGNPRKFGIKWVSASEVTFTLDGFPSTTPFTLRVEGYETAIILEDDAEPSFPTDFHDILVHGAMSDELRKMEKPDLARLAEDQYERRLSDLRMFIAKSAWMTTYQGKSKDRASNWWNQ